MLKIYGSEMCRDCTNCKMNFDYYHIEYEFYDCMKSLKYLSIFLKLRDENPIFDRLKAINDIGFPAIVDEDGSVFTDWESYLRNKGLKPISSEGAACSL